MSTEEGEPGTSDRRPAKVRSSTLRSSLVRFLLLSLLALGLVCLTFVVVTRDYARDEAMRDAVIETQAIADRIAAPALTRAVRADTVVARQRLDGELDVHLRDGSVSHLLVWDAEGRIVWSDTASLVGRRYGLPREVERLFGTHLTVVEDEGEAFGLPGGGDEDDAIEVYAGARDADGEPFVLEAYFLPARVGVESRALFWRVLPLGLGGIIALALLLLPLAFSLGRRVDRGREQRLQLVRRTLAYWHEERRRLAHDLHDTVIQDVSAARFALPVVVDALPRGPEGDAGRSVARRAEDLLDGSVEALRTLVLDLFPADLEGQGLHAALEEVARGCRSRGLDVEVRTDPALELGAARAGLVYRVVREALRNVERHAWARHAWVVVEAGAAGLRVEVSDDGRGPDAPDGSDGEPGQHFGVRMLRTLLTDVGGTLELTPRPGGGTTLLGTIPTAAG